MSCAGFYFIKVPVHTMVITRLKSMTPRPILYMSNCETKRLIFMGRHNSWFQCNDENVTKIKAPGEKLRAKPIIIDLEDDSDDK